MEMVLTVALFVLVATPIALFFLMVAMAHLMPGPPMVARSSFTCPVTGRHVDAAFLTMASAEHPTDVLTCSAFPDPERVRCAKACLEAADVAWTPSPMTPRWSLLAGSEERR